MFNIKKSFINNLHLNMLLKKITLKKQYIQKLKNKLHCHRKIKKRKNKKQSHNFCSNFLIRYIIDVTLSKTNIVLHITNSKGKIKIICSANSILLNGKNKKAKTLVLKQITNFLINKTNLFKNEPLLLRLTNIGFKKTWLFQKLKKKFFIAIFVGFNLYPYNGCRRKKVRRLK